MSIVLPFLSLALVFSITQARLHGGPRTADWRHVLLLASVVMGLWLVAVTEVLSAFTVFTPRATTLVWILLTAALLPLWVSTRRFPGRTPWPRLSFAATGVLGFALTVVLLCGFLAIVGAPNSLDAMTYHLPRTAHWLVNGSVRHYATHELRQLYNPPFAEFAIAHLSALSDSDRFVNLVQWAAMAGSLVGVSLIAKQLGGSHSAQAVSAFVAATIPMGILQASTAQNDYVTTFWTIGLVSFTLSLGRTRDWLMLVGAGACGALALATKGTVYLLGAPWALWLVVSLWRRDRRHAAMAVLICALLVLLVNGGHLARNVRLFGSPLGPTLSSETSDQLNRVRSLPVVISNVVRMLTPHMETPFEPVNAAVRAAVGWIHRAIGLDVNDPRTSRRGYDFAVNRLGVSEHESGNPLHLLLIAIVLLWSLATRRTVLSLYLLTLVSSFVLFALVFKWSPFRTRLLLPLFVLSSPIVGLWLADRARPAWRVGLLILLAIQSLPFLLLNPAHRLLGTRTIFSESRTEQLFASARWAKDIYQAGASLASTGGCDRVGWIATPGSVEYPIWPLLQAQLRGARPKLHHIEAANVSRVLENPEFDPCAVMCESCPPEITDRYAARFKTTARFRRPAGDPFVVFTIAVAR